MTAMMRIWNAKAMMITHFEMKGKKRRINSIATVETQVKKTSLVTKYGTSTAKNQAAITCGEIEKIKRNVMRTFYKLEDQDLDMF